MEYLLFDSIVSDQCSYVCEKLSGWLSCNRQYSVLHARLKHSLGSAWLWVTVKLKSLCISDSVIQCRSELSVVWLWVSESLTYSIRLTDLLCHWLMIDFVFSQLVFDFEFDWLSHWVWVSDWGEWVTAESLSDSREWRSQSTPESRCLHHRISNETRWYV